MRSLKILLIMFSLIVIVVCLFIFNNNTFNTNQTLIKARVKKVDNSDVQQASIAKIGFQRLSVVILEGKHKGKKITASNGLRGKPSLDNFYKTGDKILIALNKKGNELVAAQAVDRLRHNWTLLLFAIFIVLLLIYGGNIGIKALFSFVASLYVIWKILIPGLMNGNNPLLFSSLILVILSAIVLFSVAGFTKKGFSAFSGTVIGLLACIGIAMFFGEKMGLEGMTAPYAETLLFSGNISLNMKYIFYAAIMIGASGAAMDIAMDISASISEIKSKKPEIDFKELMKSGFNVGRAVIGTMTTTLLLAYSGSYLPLLMLFMSKHSSYTRMINYKVVTAEILRTVTGSIGLVLVAPITAVIAAWFYSVDIEISFLRNLKAHIKNGFQYYFHSDKLN